MANQTIKNIDIATLRELLTEFGYYLDSFCIDGCYFSEEDVDKFLNERHAEIQTSSEAETDQKT